MSRKRDEFATERRETIIEALSWWEDGDGRWGHERASDVLAAHEDEWCGLTSPPAVAASTGASEDEEALALNHSEVRTYQQIEDSGDTQGLTHRVNATVLAHLARQGARLTGGEREALHSLLGYERPYLWRASVVDLVERILAARIAREGR